MVYLMDKTDFHMRFHLQVKLSKSHLHSATMNNKTVIGLDFVSYRIIIAYNHEQTVLENAQKKT